MDTITLPELLPRPDYEKTYRKPLEYFVDGSIVIIVGNKKGVVTGKSVDLYEDCRIFTVLMKRQGTRQQKRIFEERHRLDHLWISNKCSRWNKRIGIPEIFAIGKIQWYVRKDGSKDLSLEPVDYKTHLENLFLGIMFMYGLHILEEARQLTMQGIVAKNYKLWDDQLSWLKLVSKKFKQTIEEKKIELEKPLMLKYIDGFLNEIEKKITKARNHVKKINQKKGFQIEKINCT
jgi:hypothetical protein